ncbi:MAG TPA: hypothetical protein VN713_06795 [Sphingomicrobium sp.]|nr:hypothetical protein [Sphingomicrobium sp.]
MRHSIALCVTILMLAAKPANAAPAPAASDWVQVPNLGGRFCVDRASIRSGQPVTFFWKECDSSDDVSEQDRLDCSQDLSKDFVMDYRFDQSSEWKSDHYGPGEPGAVIGAYVCGLVAKAS